MWEWIWWIGGIGIGTILIRLFVRFTKVEESTSKIVIRWGGIVKVFIQWTGYKLTPEGNVEAVTPAKRPWYGGLRVWVGLPIDKIHTFKLRWHSVEEVEGKRMPVFHEEMKDHVLLRPDRYWRKSIRVETNDGQFPDIEWLIGMRSINPEKTIFKSPHNWVENALTQLEPLLRRYVYTKTLKELLDLTNEQIWQDIGEDHAIKDVLKKEWGIQIDDREIGVFDVALPPGYQEALAAKSKKEMEAAGRAEEIMGTVIVAVARAEGRDEKDVQADFLKDPKVFYETHKFTIDNTMAKLSIEERAYLRIEAPGTTGIERTILNALAAWKRMPPGGKGEREIEEATRKKKWEPSERAKKIKEELEKEKKK